MDNASNHAGKGMEFPCEFVIKVFGLATNEFDETVTAIIRKHIPDVASEQVVTRPSKDGKYHALSITIQAESREQLDTIYRELTSHPLILMAL